MSGRDMDCRTQLATLANEELDKGDFLMATKMLNTGIRLEPNNHELYFERSICHHKLGDYKASLEDANTAIRLNSSDYSIHYQKGLALIGLSMFSDALTSFKKAIELRARQDDSKLSDLWKLLKDCSSEMKNARSDRSGLASRSETAHNLNNTANTNISQAQGKSADPVDSTTDRPHLNQPGTSNHHHNQSIMEGLNNNGNNNLVANNRNIQPMPNPSLTAGLNRVSSSATHVNSNLYVTPCVSNNRLDSQVMGTDMLDHSGEPLDQSKAAQFEWNIRRSERIFLHHTSAPGVAQPQYGILRYDNQDSISNQRQRTNPNPTSPSMNNGVKTNLKTPHDNELQTYQPNKISISKEGTSNAQIESDVDVDDSCNNQIRQDTSEINNPMTQPKRVLITPCSSVSASSSGQASSSTPKDDSYSSKYKRLRRDRERARRGTSKLCTIRPSDLEELQKPSPDSTPRSMRVIAPIRGWLYSGQLSVDTSGKNNGVSTHYVVKLDATGTTCDFDTNTVLNKVIKEVRVKTVSELRKGARICCYWSRQYKCLSTGVVTSRTFEATKSLVSVKYDNGDLSALPLEDLRLLPPDYPKCMSNCDPHLLGEFGESSQMAVPLSNGNGSTPDNRAVADAVLPLPNHDETKSMDTFIINNNTVATEKTDVNVEDFLNNIAPQPEVVQSNETTESLDIKYKSKEEGENVNNVEEMDEDDDEDDDATIPPTDETVEFITSESTLKQQDGNQHGREDLVERVPVTKDNIAITNDTQLAVHASRASSEENNYGVEYCPWTFDGPPKRSKRHGRTYRENYSLIRRGNEVIRIGDSAELMPRPDESTLPFVAKIEGFWATGRGEMRVRVRWYYRLIETEGEPYKLADGENALFETDHFDENDVQSIYRATKILSWTDYSRDHLGHVNKNADEIPKTFYLAGSYDPVRRVKRLESDVKEAQ